MATAKEAKSGEAVTPLESSHEQEKSETPIETQTYMNLIVKDGLNPKCMINFYRKENQVTCKRQIPKDIVQYHSDRQ